MLLAPPEACSDSLAPAVENLVDGRDDEEGEHGGVTSRATTAPISESGSAERIASGSTNDPNWMTRMRYISAIG
jgi:hypothetical protein